MALLDRRGNAAADAFQLPWLNANEQLFMESELTGATVVATALAIFSCGVCGGTWQSLKYHLHLNVSCAQAHEEGGGN